MLQCTRYLRDVGLWVKANDRGPTDSFLKFQQLCRTLVLSYVSLQLLCVGVEVEEEGNTGWEGR